MNVETKALGSRAELLPRFALPLPAEVTAGDAALTLRELIALTVRHELEAHEAHRQARSLPRELGERELAAGAAAGAIRAGERHTAPAPSADEAVRTAIEGFTDGLYLVLLDGKRCEHLEAPLAVRPTSTVTYLRLVALAGG